MAAQDGVVQGSQTQVADGFDVRTQRNEGFNMRYRSAKGCQVQDLGVEHPFVMHALNRASDEFTVFLIPIEKGFMKVRCARVLVAVRKLLSAGHLAQVIS